MKKIKTEIRVRFGECDYYQHVNNTVYMTYINIGLSDYLRSIWKDLKNLPYQIHIVHVGIDFKASATFDDTLIVETWVSKVGESSIHFQHTISNKETVVMIVEAKKICVLLDTKTGIKISVPEELRKEAA